MANDQKNNPSAGNQDQPKAGQQAGQQQKQAGQQFSSEEKNKPANDASKSTGNDKDK